MNVPARLAVGACLASHFLRSSLTPDLASTFALELQTFRAEISEAKLALSKSTLILEHCQNQTGLLFFGLKTLASLLFCLLIWLGCLIWDRRRADHPVQLPAIRDLDPGFETPETTPSHQSGSASSNLIPSGVTRVGPLRPSDLKKKTS